MVGEPSVLLAFGEPESAGLFQEWFGVGTGFQQQSDSLATGNSSESSLKASRPEAAR
jgi:hypothetical protein